MPIGYIYINKNEAPTRMCLVCGVKENPDSGIVKTEAAWLCDKCRTALLAIAVQSEVAWRERSKEEERSERGKFE